MKGLTTLVIFMSTNRNIYAHGDEFLAQGLYLKSHRGVQLGLDQSSSSTLTESSFLFESCLIHRDIVMIE